MVVCFLSVGVEVDVYGGDIDQVKGSDGLPMKIYSGRFRKYQRSTVVRYSDVVKVVKYQVTSASAG
jgi:hypothetical protein